MKFNAPFAAQLAVLNAVLDEPGSDIGQELCELAAAVATAVPSYLGLSVVVSQNNPELTVTLLDDGGTTGDIATSLMLARPNPGKSHDSASIEFVLYARSPGAFANLAADVSWLTGRPLTEFVLDAHLAVPTESDTAAPIAAASLVDQAIGVLIGRGCTAEQALREIDAKAAHSGTGRAAAAHLILARIAPGGDDQL